MSYICINVTVLLVEKASRGKLVPADKHLKDPWTWRMSGGVLPGFMQRLLSGKKDFWRKDRPESTGIEPSDEKTASSGSPKSEPIGEEAVPDKRMD